MHAGLSAVSDCAIVRKVSVMSEIRIEEDRLELR